MGGAWQEPIGIPSGLPLAYTHRCHKREFLLKFPHDRARFVSWLREARKLFSLLSKRMVLKRWQEPIGNGSRKH